MAASSATSLRRSHESSAASSKHSNSYSHSHLQRSNDNDDSGNSNNQPLDNSAPSIPVDTLVNHLLVAKRSLSSMTLVLRANDLATAARHTHEDVAILASQAGFLRTAILDQAAILVRVRRGLQATYDVGKKEFREMVLSMDDADAKLEGTMEMLRATVVEGVFRPKGEERKSLLDFVDEDSVHRMRDAMKKSIEELQGIQQSFDGDLLRFDTDIRTLKKTIVDAQVPAARDTTRPMTELLDSLVDHSADMAQLLTSLTKHFDMCVTAIRATEGAVALARRRAAEGSDAGPVSISGVIAEQESSDVAADLEPTTAADRDEMLRVVVQDADEVDDVVHEIQGRLAAMEDESASLDAHARLARRAYAGMLDAHAQLADVGDRLPDYLAAGDDFRARWDMERDAVAGQLAEMRDLRAFYEGYAAAYDRLILEAERRRAADERVRGVWRKAREAADRLLDADRAAREAFREDVGGFLPGDLWAGMQGVARRYEVVPVRTEQGGEDDDGDDDVVLRRSVVEAARARLASRE